MMGKEIYVGEGQEFEKIQDAVDSAESGDVIIVSGLTYHENVVIDKPIMLNGYLGAKIVGTLNVGHGACVRGFTIIDPKYYELR